MVAVARVMDPGVKFDKDCVYTVPLKVLINPEVLERLGRKMVLNSLVDIKTKDALEQIQGSWIVELAELGTDL